MPELPEVETVRRGLQSLLIDRLIEDVQVLRKESIAYPRPEEFAAKLKGHRFKNFSRRGKYLIIGLDKGAGFACHLRMSGRLICLNQTTKPGAFLRVRIILDKGKELRFEDMRVFGRLWYVPKGKQFEDVIPALASLGVEPLSGLSAKYLQESFAFRNQCVKGALLDQSVIAGIGNIYADEALFLSGINPQIPAKRLKAKDLERLAEQIQLVLGRAIEMGGSTLRDYKDAYGVNGNYQTDSWVYGRKGKICRVCQKGDIQSVKLAGRTAHFCSQCQPIKI